MASTTLAFLAIAVLILQAPWCAVAQQPPAGGTPADMALTSFDGARACGGQINGTALLAAVSTQWFEKGGLCHKRIRIESTQNRKFVMAEVVDECDDDHIIATSNAVWEALNLNTIAGKVPISWAKAA